MCVCVIKGRWNHTNWTRATRLVTAAGIVSVVDKFNNGSWVLLRCPFSVHSYFFSQWERVSVCVPVNSKRPFNRTMRSGIKKYADRQLRDVKVRAFLSFFEA